MIDIFDDIKKLLQKHFLNYKKAKKINKKTRNTFSTMTKTLDL